MKGDYMKKNNFTLVSPMFVANSILKKAKEKNMKINSVKLYNLIYLVYSDYLYHTQTKLFNENFSYSYKGPILPSIYFKFNCYGDEEIKTFAADAKGKIYTVHNNRLDSIINLNLDLYGYLYPEELIEITNQRSNIRQKFYNDVEISEDAKKRYLENQKVYALHLKQIENKK
jgi:uncharacterized phage-associated protein